MTDLIERIESAERARDAAILQARCWKMEAMAHRATVHEAYQLCTGRRGEPGTWNGVQPIAAALRARGEQP